MTVAEAAAAPPELEAADRSDRAFLGHPNGLGFLAFAEGCERLSSYGVQALLVLYMPHQLLLPGHVENVAFFEPFRSVVEGIFARLSPLALATTIGGSYSGFVYMTPILGGILADRVLGRTRTIT